MNRLSLYFHHHTFGEWHESYGNHHRFFHVKTTERVCSTCGEAQLQLLEIDCPHRRRTGEYCYSCQPWADRWQEMIDKSLYTPIIRDMGKYKTGQEYFQPMEKRNKALYDFLREGHTYEEAGKKFGITRARAYAIAKREVAREKQPA